MFGFINMVWRKAVFRRLLIVIVLSAIAAVFRGYSVYNLAGTEREKAIGRYKFTSYNGLSKLNDRFNQGVLGLLTLSKFLSYYNPDPSAWPDVAMLGFHDMVPELNRLTPLSDVGFVPIIKPRDLSGYESFMQNYAGIEPTCPADGKINSVRKGLFAIDPKQPNIEYLDTTGEALLYNTTSKIFVPAIEFTSSADDEPGKIKVRTLSQPLFGQVIHQVADVCSNKYNYSEAIRYCSWITKTQPVSLEDANSGCSEKSFEPKVSNFRSGIIQPVYLRHDSAELVGFVGGGVNWQEILSTSFQGLSDLECVIADDSTTFTYHINAEGAHLKGIGDLHDQAADLFQRKIQMTTTAMRESGASPYIVYLYPTMRFLEAERSGTPSIVGGGVATIVLLIMVIVLLNDVIVCREIERKAKEVEIKRQFVRYTSHEVRVPLNSMHLGLELLTSELSGLLDILSKNGPDQPAGTTTDEPAPDILHTIRETLQGWRELLGDLVRSTDSAVDVLNDLLNFDKIETGAICLDCSAVPVFAMVEKMTSAFQMQARQKCVKLMLNGRQPLEDLRKEQLADAACPSIRDVLAIADENRLAQIMRNLLSNALKFTPTGGDIDVQVGWDRARVSIAPQPQLSDARRDPVEFLPAGSMQIRVTDSGVGLSPEQLSRICSKGVQFNAKQLQAGGGSGLGLYISKRLAELHGGSLTVTSRGMGTGATFTVELPVYLTPIGLGAGTDSGSGSGGSGGGGGDFGSDAARRKTESEAAHAPQDASPSTASPPPPKRVLVVDDSESNRSMLVRLLTLRGYLCEQAEDGQRGVQLYQELCARREAVDVILMDFEMPVMDGPTATKRLRDLGCTCRIVGVTGNLLPEDVNHFKQQGVNAVLGKPLNLQVLDGLMR